MPTNSSNKPLGSVVFADPRNDKRFAKMQGAKPGSESNTDLEDRMYNAIQTWVNSSTMGEQLMKNFISKIPALAKQYPTIFKPTTPNGTILYRGLDTIQNRLWRELVKLGPEYWTPVVQSGDEIMLCKKPITYKPRGVVQSWTPDVKIAQRFAAQGALVTRQDNDFYFNSKVFSIFFGKDEKEILHVGQSYNKNVYLAVDMDLYRSEVFRKQHKTVKSLSALSQNLKETKL